jgi:hypothetical protein
MVENVSGLGRVEQDDKTFKNLSGKDVSQLRRWLRIFTVCIIASFVFSVLINAAKDTIKPNPTWPEALREGMGAPEYESVDPGKPIHQQTSMFEMAGRTFEMPKVYIQTNLGGRRVLDGINLIYVLPGFTSRADFPNRQEYERVRKEQRFAFMLLQVEATRPSFNEMIRNTRSFLPKEESVGLHDGLEYYKWYRGSPNGLVFNREIYIERDANGDITSYIECTPKESGAHVLYPNCSHKFRDKGLLYEIAYNKANYFLTWREQRLKAIAFIDGFDKSPEEKSN